MREHHADRTMSDAALDREIEQSLAVDLSPEFLARVRQRVAEQPQNRARSLAWMPVATALVVAVLIVGVVTLRPPPPEPARVTERAMSPLAAKSLIVAPGMLVAAQIPRQASIVAGDPPPIDRRSKSHEPYVKLEVLIPADEVDALKRFMRGGAVLAVDSATTSPENSELLAVQPLLPIDFASLPELSVIKIEPLSSEF